jgi:uncharacterized Ntn-hydrolase superfamily protein
MTFSIIGYDPDNGDLGVAVQSKFPNVRATVPFAEAGIGAIATQAYCNTSFGPRGLELLRNGASPQQTLDILTATDPDNRYRQVGIMDASGQSANFTGAECFDWAGGITGENFCVQGNVLHSEKVVVAMADAFQTHSGPLAVKLIQALKMGQEAGGDRRGQQSAALLVVRKQGGYGGHDDRYVDISVYDHLQPIEELSRCYEIHKLTYFKSEANKLVRIDAELGQELQRIMQQRKFYQGELHGQFDTQTNKSLHDFMGWENYDERIRDDGLIDAEVLEDIRTKHKKYLNDVS